MSIRHWRNTLAVTVMLGTVIVADATAAQAATSSVTCTGTSTVTYHPGLTHTPKTVHYDETDHYSSCISTDTTLTSGTASLSVDFPNATCNGLVGTFEYPVYPIVWNDGQTSTLSLTFTDVITLGVEQSTGVGTVTAGRYQGATAVVTLILTAADPLQCLTAQGVTSQTGSASVGITLP